jgi:predicted RND superfamily exporter protein
MGLWVLVLMACAVPPAIWGLSKVELKNDIRSWLPADDPNAVALNWYHEQFPHHESVLITWDGSTLNDPRAAWLTDKLAGVPDADGNLRGGLDYVDRVISPQELLKHIEDDGVSHEDALKRLQGVFIGTGPLKLRLTELGQQRKTSTLRSLQQSVREQLGVELELLEPVATWEPERSIDEYPTLPPIIDEYDDAWFPPGPEHHARVRWVGLQSRGELAEQIIAIATELTLGSGEDEESLVEAAYFSPGSPITLAAVLSPEGEAEKRTAIAEIRRVAVELGIPDDELHLGGRAVAGAALNQAVKQTGWDRNFPVWNLPRRSLVLFSGAIGILLAFLMLRSVVLSMLVLFAAYYSVMLTVAIVPATGGSMNMVLVVMPTLLLVLTISGAIHVANYWRFAARSGLADASTQASKMAAVPCSLASLTTALGLLSLTTSPLQPVSDFGLYAAVGCGVGLVAVLYGLPALLQYIPERIALPRACFPEFWPNVSNQITRRPTAVAAVCLVVFGMCSVGLTKFGTETRVIRFFPEDSQIVRDYRFIEENTGGIIPIDVVIRFAEEDRASVGEGLLFVERQEMVRRIQRRIIAEHPDISGSLSLATFRPEVDAAAIERVASNPFLRKVELTKDDQVLQNESARHFVTLATEDADRFVPGDHGLCEKDDELWRIAAQVNIMTDVDFDAMTEDIDNIVREEMKNVAGGNHVVTGMVPLFLRTQQAVLTSLIQSFLLAFVVIGLVISIVLRSLRAGLLTMLPNVLPISTVFGAISWFGLKVDIGTMITASVALGIAVDGTLHLLTWFRRGLRLGQTRPVAIAEALGHCGPALCQTSIAVGLGLLVLWPAELTLISRFGWMMAAMIGTALVADLVLLPALLAGGLGSLIMAADRIGTESDGAIEEHTGPETASTGQPAAEDVTPNEPTPSESREDVEHSPPPKPHVLEPEVNREPASGTNRADGSIE